MLQMLDASADRLGHTLAGRTDEPVAAPMRSRGAERRNAEEGAGRSAALPV